VGPGSSAARGQSVRIPERRTRPRLGHADRETERCGGADGIAALARAYRAELGRRDGHGGQCPQPLPGDLGGRSEMTGQIISDGHRQA